MSSNMEVAPNSYVRIGLYLRSLYYPNHASAVETPLECVKLIYCVLQMANISIKS